MRVSAIIPCHNGVDDTRACLRSLLAQQPRPDLQIVLADNASTDATPELAREFPATEVVRLAANLGFAAGVNAGLAAARGELLLIVNNDTIAAPAMLARLQRALLADSRIAAAAPVSNHVKGPARLELVDLPATPEACVAVEEALAESWAGMVQDTDTLAGLCLLLRRPTLARLGSLDTRFGLGNFEDDDLCLRARLLGHRLVIARDAFLLHRGHRTFQQLGVDYRELLRSRQEVFASKWRFDPAGSAVAAMLAGREAEAHAARALACHPRWPDAYWLLARVATARGDSAMALRHVQRFLSICPRHPEAQVLRALALGRLGHAARACAHLKWALGHCYFTEATLADALVQHASVLREQGDPAAAAGWIAQALAVRPADAELHNLHGVSLLESGQLEPALLCLDRSAALGSPHGANNAGLCLWRLGRPVEALRAWQRAVSMSPKEPAPRANLRAALQALGALREGTPADPEPHGALVS